MTVREEGNIVGAADENRWKEPGHGLFVCRRERRRIIQGNSFGYLWKYNQGKIDEGIRKTAIEMWEGMAE